MLTNFKCFSFTIKCGGEFLSKHGSDTESEDILDPKSAAKRHKLPAAFIVADVEGRLKAIRERLDVDCSDLHFYTRVLGGRWTAAHFGKVADGIAGLPCGAFAKLFCRTFKFPRHRSYRFNKYGEVNAVRLATYFCRRASYFCSIWEESDNDDFQFTVEHEALFECDDFLDWVQAQPLTSPQFTAGVLLTRLVPLGLLGHAEPVDDSDIGNSSDDEEIHHDT